MVFQDYRSLADILEELSDIRYSTKSSVNNV